MTNRLRFLIMLFLFLFLPVDPGAAQTNSGGDTQAQSASGPNESGRGAGTASSDLFTGTASAGIPIDVPPGRNGLQPTLALTYRSSNGISWVGKGWELELGAIERSTKRGVDYAADDYVVRLGGSTVDLVYIGNDAVGNREYRAKIEGGFTRFKKMTATGNPYWEVTDKTGKRYLFGQTVVSQTAVSRQDDPANNTADPNYRIFKWCLERVEDPDGNYMLFSYSKDQGQIYLDHIDYTGNGAMLPINSVKFYLESRSNMPSMYTLNFRVRTSYRLKTIDVLANGSRVRAYQLTYTANASAARSLLSSVRSFDSGANIDPNYTVTGNALPASTLTYSPESASFDQTPQNWLTFGNGDPARYKFPDLNGDGLPDVAWIGCTPSEVRVALSTGGGFKTPTSWLSNYGNCGATRYPFADFNGDGKADVVYIAANPTVFEVGFSNGTTDFGTPIPRLENFGDGDPDRYRFIDLNGDGKADVAWIGCTPSEVRVALSNGPGFNVAPVPWVSNFGNCEPGRYQFSDFNGDGKADVVYIAASPTVLQVGLSNGTTKFDTPIPVLLNFGNADPSRYRFVDMNGDGKTDIAYIACSPTQISGAFSTTGTNFTTPTIWLGNVGNCDPSRYPFVDFNGDGKVDVAYLDGSGAISVGFSMGTGFNTPTPWSTYGNADPSRYPFADYSGDGKTDLLYIDGVGGLQVAPVMGPPDNLLVQISNGLGGTSTIAYTPSTRYTNPCLPFPVQTVSAVTSNDGSGVTSTTSYSYEGGCYSIAERDFRGFNHATVTGPARDGRGRQ
ncbi:MAG: VCBS repeat-containing protein [Nitrospirae bacterium]|nr:VCBS repeat-containing protein [Nitrospirota bacterium]